MTTTDLLACSRCGVLNEVDVFRCLFCKERVDRPEDFRDRNATMAYFSRGGCVDIASSYLNGEIECDIRDADYIALLDLSVKLALESAWAGMDVVFYRDHPTLRHPFVGVKWPVQQIVKGIKLSWWEDNQERWVFECLRPEKDRKGSNSRFEEQFGDENYTYQLSLFAEVNTPRIRKIISTDPMYLLPNANGTKDSPYCLERQYSRMEVKKS